MGWRLTIRHFEKKTPCAVHLIREQLGHVLQANMRHGRNLVRLIDRRPRILARTFAHAIVDEVGSVMFATDNFMVDHFAVYEDRRLIVVPVTTGPSPDRFCAARRSRAGRS